MQPFFVRHPVYVLRKAQRIDAMNHFKQRQCMANFVFLKMPHEMPSQIRGQLRNFCARFLDPAFAEQSLPRFNRLARFLGWVCLRYGDELDIFHDPTSFCSRVRDLLAHALEILRDRIHYRGARRSECLLFLYVDVCHKQRHNEQRLLCGYRASQSSSPKFHRPKCGNGEDVTDHMCSANASVSRGRERRLEKVTHLFQAARVCSG